MLTVRLPFTHVLCLFLLLSVTGACASAPRPWQSRTVAGCATSMGADALDQERTYLATLLALSERNYAIVHSEEPLLIEAESRSDYHPELFTTRWVLSVRKNGALTVDEPSNDRSTHEKTELWYAKLTHTVQQFQCRDLNWLRWEAQNRGLMAVGAGLAASSYPGWSGGEAGEPTPVAPVSAAEPMPISPVERAERQGRLDTLRKERLDLHLWRSVGFGAVGIGFVVGGASMAISSLTPYMLCKDDPECPSNPGAPLAFVGLGFAVTGGIILAVAIPRVLRKSSRYRALSHAMKGLKEPALSLSTGTSGTPLGLTLRGSF